VSWIGKLFGQRSAAEWINKADAAWTERDYGVAKLAYESAHTAADATAGQRAHADARIMECRDLLAQARLDEAEQLAAGGDEASLELARVEIRNALQIAASDSVLQRARGQAERLEHGQARQHAQELAAEEPDVLATIAGTWEPEQAEEYDTYGQPLIDALVAVHEGRAQDALAALNALLTNAKDPHYLCFEVGRAQLITGDVEAATAMLRKFLASIGPDEGGETRLVAHMELATLAKSRGDFDGAVHELENAIEALPEDPRPYVSLGVFLRTEGHAAEAIEVLEAAQSVIGEGRPEWRILQELGLAHAAIGNTARAVGLLEEVIQTFATQRLSDLPPDTAAPLAKLHEDAGNRARAADLYASLARGTDRDRLYDYCFAAGRLLADLDQRDDARRLLQQAVEFARTAPERQAAEALLNTAC
jgi:tetratricopeptide (TPR) repeat protein